MHLNLDNELYNINLMLLFIQIIVDHEYNISLNIENDLIFSEVFEQIKLNFPVSIA